MSGGAVADATGNWVDTLAPAWLRPYLRLARLDRPIGSWLLLLPCWWSSALAAVAAHARAPNILHLVLFFIGAFAMRGAGCTWNDIVDRDLDGSRRAHPLAAYSFRPSQRCASGFVPRPASAYRLCRIDHVQRLHRRARHRFARHRRGLSVHEAHHLLAANRARAGVFLGRADGLGRRLRPARSGAAVCSMPDRSPG